MSKHAALAADLRQRINPSYAAQRGTESYERRECAEAIEGLLTINAELLETRRIEMTKELLQQALDVLLSYNAEEFVAGQQVVESLRAAIAQPVQPAEYVAKAVAWQSAVTGGVSTARLYFDNDEPLIPLYPHPALAQPVQPAPGWLLVPVEPTPGMLRPFLECPPDELALAWAAMVIVAKSSYTDAAAQPVPPAIGNAVHQIRPIGTLNWGVTDSDGETAIKRMPHWQGKYEFRTLYELARPVQPATPITQTVKDLDAAFLSITPLPWFVAADGSGIGLNGDRWSSNGGFVNVTKENVKKFGGSHFNNLRWLCLLANNWQAIRESIAQPVQPIPFSGADEGKPVFARRWSLAVDGFGLQRDDNGNYVDIDDALSVLHALAQPVQPAETDLQQAAQAVLDRWDSPKWDWEKDGPTANLMYFMRIALARPKEPS